MPVSDIPQAILNDVRQRSGGALADDIALLAISIL